ncbi:ABC transporter permease [Georgenia sp. Z1344]|uniref:ABC transporter permease n=1 Tax=Georgenia sp. Z1344 TaxID=3416706 RepID=UPI003CEA6A70
MSPALRRALAQARFDTIGTLRNGEQLLLTLLMPIGALIGLVITGIVDLPLSDSGQEHGAALGSALALAISAAGLPSVAIALAFDRRWGVLRQLATTPLGPRGLLAGRAGAVLALVVVQVVLLTATALVVGWRPDLGAWPVTVPVGLLTVLLGTAAFTGFGVIVGGTLRAEAVLAISNTLWVLLAAGGGVLAPTSTYPDWWGAIVSVTPSGALGEALRSLATPGSPDWLSVAILAAWAVVLPVVAARVVRWQE